MLFRMRTTLVIMCMGQLLLSHAQTFSRRYDLYGQQLGNEAWCIDRNADGGYSIAAASQYVDTAMLYSASVMVRIDGEGALLSETKMTDVICGIYPGWSNSADVLPDGSLIVGAGKACPDDMNIAALAHFGANGDSIWFRQYDPGSGSWIGRQAKVCKDGGFILCGETTATGVSDGFVIKTDNNGMEQWRQTYGGPFIDYIVAVDTTADDGYFIGGEYRLSPDNLDLWVSRLTATGDTLWSTIWGSEFDEPNAHLTTLANGNPMVASAWGTAPDFVLDKCYMAELDQDDGSIVWERTYGTANYLGTLYTPKEVGPGEGCIAAGYIEEGGVNIPFWRGVMLRTAANGDSIWMRTYYYYDSLMTNGMGYFRDVLPAQDGGFLAAGTALTAYDGTLPPGYDNQDVWVVKVDSMGCLVPGCDVPMGLTTQITNMGYALNIYPNPVHDQLHVTIKLPANFQTEGPLFLSVTSQDGKMVQQRQVPTSSSGEVLLDVTGLAAGAYDLHLSDAHTWIAGKRFVVE